jgi:hypothetical protein
VIGAYSAGVLGGIQSKRLLLSGIYLSRAVVFALFVRVPTTPFIVWWISIVLSLAAAAVHLPIHERRAAAWAPSPA